MKFRILEDTTRKEGVRYIIQKKVFILWFKLDDILYIDTDKANTAIINYIKRGKTSCIKIIETSEPNVIINHKG